MDTFLNGLVLILPTILSWLGIYLTIKAPLDKHKALWVTGLLFFGISISILTFVQQSRTEAQKYRTEMQNKVKQDKLLEATRKNERANQYLCGQLDTVYAVIRQISDHQMNNNDKQILTALSKLIKTSQAQNTRSALISGTGTITESDSVAMHETGTAAGTGAGTLDNSKLDEFKLY
jgi:hypothetical protein